LAFIHESHLIRLDHILMTRPCPSIHRSYPRLSKTIKGKGRTQAERSESEETSDEDISDSLEVPDDDGIPSTQYDPGEDEAETAVEDIYALWEARTTARNAKLARTSTFQQSVSPFSGMQC
jgi:hypothetical protein